MGWGVFVILALSKWIGSMNTLERKTRERVLLAYTVVFKVKVKSNVANTLSLQHSNCMFKTILMYELHHLSAGNISFRAVTKPTVPGGSSTMSFSYTCGSQWSS